MSEDTRPRPTEKLIVRNFLSIRSAELEIKRFNVIIGTQAQGKSVLATLLYFFRQFLSEEFVASIQNQEEQATFEQSLLLRFLIFFPIDRIQNDEPFEIVYISDNLEIRVFKDQGESVKIVYPDALKVLRNNSIQSLATEIEESLNLSNGAEHTRMRQIRYIPLRYVLQSEFRYSLHYSTFIPASRTFFAEIDKNIFSFLVRDVEIDPLLEEFGAVYEKRKRLSANADYFASFYNPDASKTVGELYTENILMGKYVRENEQDWIVSGGRRTNILNASSGQQSALPMLYILVEGFNWPLGQTPPMYLVEELEAHLFPNSQKVIIEMMAHLHNHNDSSFFLTTHSPYVLTAINNLLYASELYDGGDETVKDEVVEHVPTYHFIRYDDLSAYTIEDGVLRSILDEETQLIDATVIDAVSEQFDDVFDGLLEIGYRQKNGL